MPDESPNQPPTVVNVHLDNTNTAAATAEASAAATAAEASPPPAPVLSRKSTPRAYLSFGLGFWIAYHRLYLGRPSGLWLTGLWLPLLLWRVMAQEGAADASLLPLFLVSLGLLVHDALAIPVWVRRNNRALRMANARPEPISRAVASAASPDQASPPAPSRLLETEKDNLRTRLLRAAHLGDGKLTVTQAVMETGESWPKVERALRKMVKKGYIDVDNAPDSGVVVYLFPELLGRPSLADREPGLDQDPA